MGVERAPPIQMDGRLAAWPQWPEFSMADGELERYYLDLKRTIVAQYGEEVLELAWVQVYMNLESVTKEIMSKGTDIIPNLTFDEITTLNDAQRQEILSKGCCVVRGVIPESEARLWFSQLEGFIMDNRLKLDKRYQSSA